MVWFHLISPARIVTRVASGKWGYGNCMKWSLLQSCSRLCWVPRNSFACTNQLIIMQWHTENDFGKSSTLLTQSEDDSGNRVGAGHGKKIGKKLGEKLVRKKESSVRVEKIEPKKKEWYTPDPVEVTQWLRTDIADLQREHHWFQHYLMFSFIRDYHFIV